MTLLLGILIGYLAQRSGFCSIGGFRDLLLFKQTRLFVGFLALIGGAFIGYLLFSLIVPEAFPGFFWIIEKPFTETPAIPGGPVSTVGGAIIYAILGGIGMGLVGVLLGGCPLRQMVMGSEGSIKSLYFFLGLLIGAVLFHLLLKDYIFVPLIELIFPAG
ncbi:MAG: YeeE/YedE family protein [Candidatus Lokiarchaeota archaeon]|nr:YeeE/YedE family protein [Candidatus Lokiarchaeota archaeon]